MKINIRRADERGVTNRGWLKSYHSFSFSDYYDEQHMGYHSLRVINDDVVNPGMGFGTHPHKDMEIISYIVSGVMELQDSMGNRFIIKTGDIQKMSAGSGLTHSEFNYNRDKPLHFLQIWIEPQKMGIEPEYRQIEIKDEDKLNRFKLVVSPDGADSSIKVYQKVRIYASLLEKGAETDFSTDPESKYWVQIVKGELHTCGETLHTGDGASVEGVASLKFSGAETTEFLLFEIL